jgi:hypothetical protein
MSGKSRALALALATAGTIGFGAPMASAATTSVAGHHGGILNVNVSNNQIPIAAGVLGSATAGTLLGSAGGSSSSYYYDPYDAAAYDAAVYGASAAGCSSACGGGSSTTVVPSGSATGCDCGTSTSVVPGGAVIPGGEVVIPPRIGGPFGYRAGGPFGYRAGGGGLLGGGGGLINVNASNNQIPIAAGVLGNATAGTGGLAGADVLGLLSPAGSFVTGPGGEVIYPGGEVIPCPPSAP